MSHYPRNFRLYRSLFGCVLLHGVCTALVVGNDDMASSYCIGVMTRRLAGRREGSRGVREVANY